MRYPSGPCHTYVSYKQLHHGPIDSKGTRLISGTATIWCIRNYHIIINLSVGSLGTVIDHLFLPPIHHMGEPGL